MFTLNWTDFFSGQASGIIDGEGCISLIPKGRFQPNINVTFTDEYACNWYIEKSGVGFLCHNELNGRKPAFHWVIATPEKVLAVLNKVELIIKLQHKALMIEACEMLLDIRVYDRERMNQIYTELRVLNKR